MFPINFNFPYRKKDGSIITMEKALDGAGADLDLVDLDDVAIINPTGGDGLVYDATAQKWENKQITTKEQWQNNGAYNLANCVADTEVKSGFTLTKVVDSNTGGVTYTISGTDSGSTGTQYIVANDAELLATMKHYAGKKVKLVGCPTGGDTTNGYFVAIYFNYGAGDVPATYNDIGDGVEVSVPATVNTARLAITLRHNANPSGKTFKPMITTDLNATYDDYQPYAKTNRELTEDVTSLKSALLLKRVVNSADNLNDIKEIGTYAISTTPTNLPSEAAYSSLMVLPLSTSLTGSSGIMQIVSKQGAIYTRAFTGSPLAWTSWVKFTGTIVS